MGITQIDSHIECNNSMWFSFFKRILCHCSAGSLISAKLMIVIGRLIRTAEASGRLPYALATVDTAVAEELHTIRCILSATHVRRLLNRY